MSAQALWFTAPRSVELREVASKSLPADSVRVRTEVSAISSGTELLFYRGELEDGVAADATLAWGEAAARYPFQYGYASVGVVEEASNAALVGRRVFSFHPHQEVTVDLASAFFPVPDGVSAEAATFLANLETAVSLVMDGGPLLGERVAVVGQGVVGQLTAALLVETGVEEVHLIDSLAERLPGRLVPASARCTSATAVSAQTRETFDLVFELSGRPEALDSALQLARYAGRIVVGSWYGNRRAPLELGTRVHRSRLTLSFSQVSTIDPRHAARFDKARRLEVVWQWLKRLPVELLVSHRVPFAEAARAYQMLDSRPPGVMQVLLTHR
jgi:2-desacetyl-2-hydroxyethyl bacteriochlorophyllide A dehydrogenase